MSPLPRRLPAFVRNVWAGRLARLIVIGVAIWLMAAPPLLGYEDTSAADSDRIIGPIAGALAFVALWAVLVGLRWVTLPCGLWLLVAPLLLDAGTAVWTASSVITGVVVVLTAPIGPDVRAEFDGGWATVGLSRWSRSAEST